MPAYSVLETEENTGGIIFAKDRRTATKWGADNYADGDVGYIEVTRRRDLDQYEGKGVPARVLVAEGWWFECHGCGIMIRDYEMEEAGLPLSGVVGIEAGAIFCCHTCRMEHLAREAQIKAFGEAFLDMLRDRVRARFGQDVRFVDAGSWKDHIYIRRGVDPLVVHQARVGFHFPGEKIGPATLEYHHCGPHGSDITGPVALELRCCNGDREAFEAWAETTAPSAEGGRE